MALPLLICFTYYTLNFRKFKHSYFVVVGIICLYCISLLIIYEFLKGSFNIYILIVNIIISVLFLFLKDKYGSELVNIYANMIAKFSTMIPVFFFIFIGLFAAIFTQPIAYLLTFYLLKIEYEKINKLVYLNLVVSWLLLFQIYWMYFGHKLFQY